MCTFWCNIAPSLSFIPLATQCIHYLSLGYSNEGRDMIPESLGRGIVSGLMLPCPFWLTFLVLVQCRGPSFSSVSRKQHLDFKHFSAVGFVCWLQAMLSSVIRFIKFRWNKFVYTWNTSCVHAQTNWISERNKCGNCRFRTGEVCGELTLLCCL